MLTCLVITPRGARTVECALLAKPTRRMELYTAAVVLEQRVAARARVIRLGQGGAGC